MKINNPTEEKLFSVIERFKKIYSFKEKKYIRRSASDPACRILNGIGQRYILSERGIMHKGTGYSDNIRRGTYIKDQGRQNPFFTGGMGKGDIYRRDKSYISPEI